MKKSISILFSLLSFLVLCAFSFKASTPPSTMYPALEAFFSSLETKKIDNSRLPALQKIKEDISSSNQYFDETNLVFYCSENSFRSQASQVFAQTLCAVNKRRKVKVFSTGVVATEVDPRLISYLKKIGYKVNSTINEGKITYELKYSDRSDPIILYSKGPTDKTLPKNNITSIIVCDMQMETECKDLHTATTAVKLPFVKITKGDTDDKIELTIRNIAAEMAYVTKK